jgi:hypothetical protein
MSVSEVMLRVQDSVGFWAGPSADDDDLLEARWRSEYETYDQPVAMFTGDTEPLGVHADWERGINLYVVQVWILSPR